MAASDRPKLLVAAPDGVVYEHPTLELAIDNGQSISRAGAKDLIALPEGWDLTAMPGTRPVGYDPLAAKFTTSALRRLAASSKDERVRVEAS